MRQITSVQSDKNTKKADQNGFIPMMLTLLALVLFVIIFVFLRVVKVHR